MKVTAYNLIIPGNYGETLVFNRKNGKFEPHASSRDADTFFTSHYEAEKTHVREYDKNPRFMCIQAFDVQFEHSVFEHTGCYNVCRKY